MSSSLSAIQVSNMVTYTIMQPHIWKLVHCHLFLIDQLAFVNCICTCKTFHELSYKEPMIIRRIVLLYIEEVYKKNKNEMYLMPSREYCEEYERTQPYEELRATLNTAFLKIVKIEAIENKEADKKDWDSNLSKRFEDSVSKKAFSEAFLSAQKILDPHMRNDSLLKLIKLIADRDATQATTFVHKNECYNNIKKEAFFEIAKIAVSATPSLAESYIFTDDYQFDDHEKLEVFSILAKHNLHAAEKLIHRFPLPGPGLFESYLQAKALGEILKVLALTEPYRAATRAVKITHPPYSLFAGVFEIIVEANVDIALKIAEEIPKTPHDKEDALIMLTAKFDSSGDIMKTLNFALKLEDPELRSFYLLSCLKKLYEKDPAEFVNLVIEEDDFFCAKAKVEAINNQDPKETLKKIKRKEAINSVRSEILKIQIEKNPQLAMNFVQESESNIKNINAFDDRLVVILQAVKKKDLHTALEIALKLRKTKLRNEQLKDLLSHSKFTKNYAFALKFIEKIKHQELKPEDNIPMLESLAASISV